MTKDQPTSLKKSLIGGACISLQPLMLSALSVPVTAYLIRHLGPTAYGQWVTATALIAVSMMLANLGLRGSFVRALARQPDAAGILLAEQLGLRLLLSAVAVPATLLACVGLGYSDVVLQCTIIAGVGLILTTVASTFADVLHALQRLPTLAAVNLAAGVALTAASIFAALLGGGPASIALTYLVGPLIGAVALAMILRRAHFEMRVTWNLRRFAALLKESRSFAAQQLSIAASSHAQSLLLPSLVGASGFGFFTAGSLLGTRLTVLPDGLSAAAYPAIAKAYQQSPRLGAWLMLRYGVVMLLVTLPVAICAMWLANPVARLLFPNQFALCEQVIRITIWLVPIVGIECIMGYSLNAAGKEAAHARALIPGGLCGLLLTLMLVMNFGIAGACWASLACSAVRMSFMLPTFVRTCLPPLLQRANADSYQPASSVERVRETASSVVVPMADVASRMTSSTAVPRKMPVRKAG